jgi:threonine aldolase
MFKGIDLFSDTMTKPTDEMKKHMISVDVGDEQKGEDPTTLELERMVANMLGFESALFFPSSTMCNQVALKVLSQPGDELIGAENCHLFSAEAGGPAIHSSLMSRPIETQNGIFSGQDVKKMIRKIKSPNYPISKIVSIENTTNLGGGQAWELAQIQDVIQVAKEYELKTHLDGSRLFNAVVKTKNSPKEICEGFDTVTICLSKGLGCPMGAVLAFSKLHFEKIRRLKQIFGGSMRQSGILAAAGIYALKNNIERLQKDHDNTNFFANLIREKIPQIKIENETPNTNMVFFSWLGQTQTPDEFYNKCLKRGVRFSRMEENRFRAVFHLNICKHDTEIAVEIMQKIAES